MKPLRLGTLFGVTITFAPSAWLGSAALLVVFTLALAARLPLPEALLGGVLLTLCHWASEVAHQMGHAFAARRVGYPMTGLLLFAVIGRSLYPPDEPELPARIHIQRALGGAPVSIGIGVLLALLTLPFPPGTLVWAVLAGASALNLLLFGFGAFVPLSFTDGSTLLRYWGK